MEPNSRSEAGVIRLSASETPGYTHVDNITDRSAQKASDLLTANHDVFHTRFNGGLHNHLVHHILAIYALGATPDEIQDMWNDNISYQAPLEPPSDPATPPRNLKDPAVFNECLGKDECYSDFLRFFEDEVTQKGVPDVVNEYVFKGDDRANDIFCRMFTDLVHPLIHLGCALEFSQPSLVAESLAAACVHGAWPASVLLPTETYLQSHPDTPSVPLLSVLSALRADPNISTAVKPTDPFNKIPDGLLVRIPPAVFAPYLASYRVSPDPDSLRDALSDLIHTCVYMTGAAQHPDKLVAMDFVLLHSVTVLAFYPAVMQIPWISDASKARLLEATGRIAAVMYAGCRCPELYPSRITAYLPKYPEHGWEELAHRSNVYQDEGHVAKFTRAMLALEKHVPMGALERDFPIGKKDFFKIAHMGVDSAERAFEEPEKGGHKMPEGVAEGVVKRVGLGGEMVAKNQMRWVFYGGLEGAWGWVANRDEVSKA
ncbi:hypothetical protein QBC35DRAFT_39643 [Podospora australis]|uniref:Oxidoreductase AflY n=1 Tax=Podospora australis TaxID=1536484 RepID=A0AAN7AG91_9PEZI|nr:hypothetical protein QBC35DRAFT_39643 [Podospora australis]